MNNKNTIKMMAIAGLFATMAIPTSSVFATPTVFGELLYDGVVYRTLVPPSESKLGLDAYYPIIGGVSGQLGIIAVAPGDVDYHGGHWAQYDVTFNVAPYQLNSEADVLTAESLGDVTIDRVTVEKFICPVILGDP